MALDDIPTRRPSSACVKPRALRNFSRWNRNRGLRCLGCLIVSELYGFVVTLSIENMRFCQISSYFCLSLCLAKMYAIIV